jgi:SAM-dependent methyltransferase
MHIGFKNHYFKELAEFEGGNFWFRARNRLILWALVKYSKKFTNFLEIGCGTGFVVSAIANQFPSTHAVGSEVLDGGLSYARQRNSRVNFIQMDARNIPFQSAFDAIGIFDVLEHIEDDEAVLMQIFEALRPGGLVYITVPQHKWLWSAADDYACHVRRYSNKELLLKIGRAKLELVESTSFITLLLPAMCISRLSLKKYNRSMNMDDIAGLRLHPMVNKIFEWFANVDMALINFGISLPAGGSRFVIARKPK